MKHNAIFHAGFMCLALCGVLTSCSNTFDDESVDDNALHVITVDVAQDVWTATVRSSADEAESTTPAFPIHYLLFDASQQYLETKTLTSGSETSVSFTEPKGSYYIYAVCGAALPDNFVPSVDAAMAFATSSDVCLGSTQVTIENYSDQPKVNILAKHVFSKLALKITDVPSDVANIKAVITPLYNSIQLNGTYVTSTDDTAVTLELQSTSDQTTTWTYAENYIYPSSEKISVTLNVTYQDQSTEQMSTTTSYTLAARQPLHLSAKFRNISSVTPGVETEAWATPLEEEISFGASADNNTGTTDNTNGEHKDDQSTGNTNGETSESNKETESSTPSTDQTGSSTSSTLWSRYGSSSAFVLDETDEYTLIMGALAQTGVEYDDAVSIESNYGTTVGLPNVTWRIPTEAELKKLFAKYTTVTALKSFLQSIYASSETVYSSTYFICTVSTNQIAMRTMSGSPITITDYSSLTDAYLYPVAEIAKK